MLVSAAVVMKEHPLLWNWFGGSGAFLVWFGGTGGFLVWLGGSGGLLVWFGGSGGFLVLVSAGVGMKERPRAITGEPPAAVSTCHFSIIVNAHTAQACRTL